MKNPESPSPACPNFPITELEIATQQFEMTLVDENLDAIAYLKEEMIDDTIPIKLAEYAGSLWDPEFREDYDTNP